MSCKSSTSERNDAVSSYMVVNSSSICVIKEVTVDVYETISENYSPNVV
jgi:hypothetical protein